MKRHLSKRQFAYQYATTGEALCNFLRNWLFDGIASDHMSEIHEHQYRHAILPKLKATSIRRALSNSGNPPLFSDVVDVKHRILPMIVVL